MVNFGFTDLWIVGSENLNFELENDARCGQHRAVWGLHHHHHFCERNFCERSVGKRYTDEVCRAMSMCGREVLSRARRVGTISEAVRRRRHVICVSRSLGLDDIARRERMRAI
jgi:tRNA C32,U32 (ribose-2'-O)-methylase TrmJ